MGRYEGYLSLANDDLTRLAKGFDSAANLLKDAGMNFNTGLEVGLRRKALDQEQRQFDKTFSLNLLTAERERQHQIVEEDLSRKEVSLEEKQLIDQRLNFRENMAFQRAVEEMNETERRAAREFRVTSFEADDKHRKNMLQLEQDKLNEARIANNAAAVKDEIDRLTRTLSAANPGIDQNYINSLLSGVSQQYAYGSNPSTVISALRRESKQISDTAGHMTDVTNKLTQDLVFGNYDKSFFAAVSPRDALTKVNAAGFSTTDENAAQTLWSVVRNSAVVRASGALDERIKEIAPVLDLLNNYDPKKVENKYDYLPLTQALEDAEMTKEDFRGLVKLAQDFRDYSGGTSFAQSTLIQTAAGYAAKRFMHDEHVTRQASEAPHNTAVKPTAGGKWQ